MNNQLTLRHEVICGCSGRQKQKASLTLSAQFHYNHDRRGSSVHCSQLCRGDFAADTAFYRPDIEKPLDHPDLRPPTARSVGRGHGVVRHAGQRRAPADWPRDTPGRTVDLIRDPSPTIAATYLSSIFRTKSPLRLASVPPLPLCGACMAARPNIRPHIFPIHIGQSVGAHTLCII